MSSRTCAVERRPWGDPEGAELRRRQRVELDARDGSTEHEPGAPLFGAYAGSTPSVSFERVLDGPA